MNQNELSNYTFYSRYSQNNKKTGKRESWNEAVKRIFDMHRFKYSEQISKNPELELLIDRAEQAQIKKKALSAQRLLQVGGEMTLRKNARNYNCSGIAIDKPKAFQNFVWLLLCGTGVGMSVQKFDIEKLPKIKKPSDEKITYTIPDSIEGWADSVGVLLSTYFEDGGYFPEYKCKKVNFDYSLIRPKGSLIGGQFKAPGPEPLKRGLEIMRGILGFVAQENRQLKSIEAYDILMHAADFVVSSGLRRSAVLSLFSHDDEEMMKAKTGDWFIKNPQRGRSNNSAALIKDETTEDQFSNLFQHTKQFGEPGFIFVDNLHVLLNPCSEISWCIPRTTSKECIVGLCNLTEINGGYCKTPEKFYETCEAATIMGTLQAGYTDFSYLGKEAEEFVRKESLLGVSITGWMENPDILFNPEILEHGAKLIKETNTKVAAMLGINKAARLTCAKPSGHTSIILSTSSGIHPHHAKRYIRNVQSNKQDWTVQVIQNENPVAVQESAWNPNGTDVVISFACEVPKGSILKNQIGAVELLEKIKIAQKHWVGAGINDDRNDCKGLTHSVSNTVAVRENEWQEVEDFIYENRHYFTGVSLLSKDGDLDYVQAPFTAVLTPSEIVSEYGDASILASGLIVDGLHAFEGDLWAACATALGKGKPIPEVEEPTIPTKQNVKELTAYSQAKILFDDAWKKKDWTRRLGQFAARYFEGNLDKATYCLKHVSLWKTWCDLRRECKEIDWSKYTSGKNDLVDASDLAASACSGGQCVVNF